jgi:hypothetical protein
MTWSVQIITRMQQIQNSHFQKGLIVESKPLIWVRIETVNPATRAENIPKLTP